MMGEGDDIIVMKCDYSEWIRKRVVQHDIPHLRLKPQIENENETGLLDVPVELIFMIISELGIKEVGSLSKTCRYFYNFVNDNFVKEVLLPLSSENMPKVSGENGRHILRLSSNVNIRWWQSGFEGMLNSLKLKYLKEIKFVGPNYYTSGDKTFLLDEYKKILSSVVLTKSHLRRIDISLELTEQYCTILQQLKRLPRLEELCLRPHRFNQRRDTVLSLNQVLKQILQGLRIKTFELTKLQDDAGFGQPCSYFGLIVSSEYIENFILHMGKELYLGDIHAMNLRKLTIHSEFYCGGRAGSAGCINHWEIYDNHYALEYGSIRKLAHIVEKGCPNLEYFNNRKISLHESRENSLEKKDCRQCQEKRITNSGTYQALERKMLSYKKQAELYQKQLRIRNKDNKECVNTIINLEKKLRESYNSVPNRKQKRGKASVSKRKQKRGKASKPLPFQCDKCQKSFMKEKGLKIHKGRMHKV